MLLRNLNVVGMSGLHDIDIIDEKIGAVIPSDDAILRENSTDQLSFTGAIAFPGLVNSHDHLDFNLFPQIGNRIYKNYTEWGRDIQQTNSGEIARVLKVPLPLRVEWGLYKNLLNGITTVVNHGSALEINSNLITVYEACRSLHSPGFEKNWQWKMNNPFARRQAVVMHIGEGTDLPATREIDQVIAWNFLRRKVIAVHGVAMTKAQAIHLHALVWCPASNFFLLDRTAAISELKQFIPVLFGTDSTLTASWNLWEQLRTARDQNGVTDDELLNMLTVTPGEIWQIDNCRFIDAGQAADVVVAKMQPGKKGLAAVFATNPADILLVLHKGRVQLFDVSLREKLQVTGIDTGKYSRIAINGEHKFVEGDLPALMKNIAAYFPDVQFPVYAAQEDDESELKDAFQENR